MTAKSEKLAVVVADFRFSTPRQVFSAARQAGGPAMFQAAIAILFHSEKKQVPVEILRPAKKADLGFAQRFEIMANTRHIKVGVTDDRNGVRYVASLEFTDQDVAHLNRVIDEFRVVCSDVSTELVSLRIQRLHRSGYSPVATNRLLRRQYSQLAGLILLADDSRKYTSAIEEGVRRIHMCAAHTEIIGIDLCA